MGLDLIKRTYRTSFIVAILVFLYTWGYYSFPSAVGILTGTIWGCLNLFFITNLVTSFIKVEEKDYPKIWILLLVKFPILYGLGFLALIIGYFEPLTFLLGFSLVLAVIILKVLGKYLLDSVLKQNLKEKKL
ncbi:MAG: hypothetical protein A2145_03380 [candidate division Zixibacteria bacterium RBG_16_40_9]|nr:MAG: hypothetical protein A2145_03380 [candidate division Zixibacteria bacterium RBG_16_40_9]